MKKIALSLLAIILFGAFCSAFAVEVTLLGPKQYLRKNGSPTKYSDTFPGKIGQGTLTLKNGEQTGTKRISSAIVKVNGIQIFGANSFAHNTYDLEAPVTLQESNIISVELRSAPGSYMAIRVNENIEADSAALIGSEGGSLCVSDTASPFFGIDIFVPVGSVKVPSLFTISAVKNEPDIPLPNGIQLDGPMISFAASPSLQGPVVASIPFIGDRAEGERRFLFHFEERNQTWKLAEPLPGENESKMRVLLRSFSTYSKGRAYISDNAAYSGFNICVDSLRSTNSSGLTCNYDDGRSEDGGICVGFSLVAEQYFISFANPNQVGLKCWWTWDKSWDVACKAQGAFNGGGNGLKDNIVSIFNTLGIFTSFTLDESYLLDYLWKRLKENMPTTIVMLGPNGGHSVLVTGWKKTGSFMGKLLVYENQNNTSREIEHFRTGTWILPITEMAYLDTNSHEYALFANASSLFTNYPYINNIITGEPRNNYSTCSDCNLIPNPSFENGTGQWPDMWKPNDSTATYIWENSGAHSGSRSVGVTHTDYNLTGRAGWITTSMIPIDPNKTYEISVWYKWSEEKGIGETTEIGIFYYDAQGKLLDYGGLPHRLNSIYSIGSWRQGSVQFGPGFWEPYHPAFIKISISRIDWDQEVGNYNAIFWIDDVSLVEK
jgi:hypothetical protein